MASLLLTIAKSKQTDFLKTIREVVATLKAICNDPEKQEQDRLSTATSKLAEKWQKYEDSQYNVLGLVTKDEVEVELAIFFELEEIYEAAIDKANKISKKRKDEQEQEMMTPPPITYDEDEEHNDNDEEDEEKDKDYDVNDHEEDDNVLPPAIKEEENSNYDEPLRNRLAKKGESSNDSPSDDKDKVYANKEEKVAEALEEVKTEDEAPNELLRDTATQEEVTADDTGGYVHVPAKVPPAVHTVKTPALEAPADKVPAPAGAKVPAATEVEVPAAATEVEVPAVQSLVKILD